MQASDLVGEEAVGFYEQNLKQLEWYPSKSQEQKQGKIIKDEYPPHHTHQKKKTQS